MATAGQIWSSVKLGISHCLGCEEHFHIVNHEAWLQQGDMKLLEQFNVGGTLLAQNNFYEHINRSKPYGQTSN